MTEKFVRTVTVWNPKTKLRQEVTVAVAIDIDAVASCMGAQAIRNKSQKSRQLSGRIVCSVREVKVPVAPAKPRLVELERMLGWAFNPDKD